MDTQKELDWSSEKMDPSGRYDQQRSNLRRTVVDESGLVVAPVKQQLSENN